MEYTDFNSAFESALNYLTDGATFLKEFWEVVPAEVQSLIFAVFVVIVGFGVVLKIFNVVTG